MKKITQEHRKCTKGNAANNKKKLGKWLLQRIKQNSMNLEKSINLVVEDKEDHVVHSDKDFNSKYFITLLTPALQNSGNSPP